VNRPSRRHPLLELELDPVRKRPMVAAAIFVGVLAVRKVGT
jgi:hypothetical protein